MLIASLFLLYQFGQVPKGIHVDEAGMAYDAMCIANYGVDRYLYRLPIYFVNFGGGQNALYTYLASIAIKLFGYSISVIRLPAVILGMMTIIFTYKMVRENVGKKEGLLIAFLLAVCPWHIMKSRWGLESYLLSSMFLLSICSFVKAIKTRKYRWYGLTGLLFGITLYTYAVSYIILPIFLLLTISYLLWSKKISLKELIVMAIPLGILAIPLILMLAYNSGIISNVKLPIISIPTLWGFRGQEVSISNISANLPNMFQILFLKDSLLYNGFGAVGTLYKMSIPLVIIGFILCIMETLVKFKKKEISVDMIMVIAFICSFLCALLVKDPNINKVNAIYIPMLYFAMKSISYMAKNGKRIIIIFVVLFGINAIYFGKFYFGEYKQYNQIYFESDLIEATKVALCSNKETIYVERGGVEQVYIYTLCANAISPYEFVNTLKKDENNQITSYANYVFDIPDELDENGVYIIREDVSQIQKMIENGYHVLEVNSYRVLYK